MLTIFIKSEANNEAAKKLAKRKSYDKHAQVSDTDSISEFLCNDKFFLLLHRPPSQSPVWHRTVPTAVPISLYGASLCTVCAKVSEKRKISLNSIL